MRRPRLRFRLRRMMAGVAILAVFFGVVVALRRKSEVFRRDSQVHARKAQTYADVGWGLQRFKEGDARVDEANQRLASRYWHLHTYHRQLKGKYERAAARPWLPVVPDPPPPPEP
jgi:hypothetical protein